MSEGIPEVRQIAQKLAEERQRGLDPTSPTPTVREFISWFNIQRRRPRLVEIIRAELEHCGLHTVPDFQNVHIDSQISFRDSSAPTIPEDSTLRIDSLDAANKGDKVISVTPTDSLETATTLMMCNDFSQLPVMAGQKSVKGVISWESIGRKAAAGQIGDQVRHYMEKPHILEGDQPLFDAVNVVAGHGYVLVKARDGTITGIVTASDLNCLFLELAEPFLLVGEIEKHIRRIIHGKFTLDEILSAKVPSTKDAQGSSTGESTDHIASLTLGDYCHLLENPDHWQKLNLPFDRKSFVQQLHQVREIRNNVMHFNPDGTDPEEVQKLRTMSRLFGSLPSNSTT